jgi:iron complex transport system substrate-binding protein
VCLTEEPTEVLHLLGEGARIVGISAWTCRPPEAREMAPIVSAFTGGNVARIAALEPDLVIGFSDIQADLAQQLVKAQQQVLITNQRSIEEILDVILLLGRIVGREQKAQDLVDGYRRRIDDVERRSRAHGRRPRVYFEEWPDPMISGIRWVSELVAIAGGEDVFADRAKGKGAKERFVTSDEVVARDPEVIVASWCGKPVDKTAFGKRAGWERVTAVKRGQVHEVESTRILQPGPAALTDGLDDLVQIVEGA